MKESLDLLKTKFRPECEQFYNYFRWYPKIFHISDHYWFEIKNFKFLLNDNKHESMFYKTMKCHKLENQAQAVENAYFRDMSSSISEEEKRFELNKNIFKRYYEHIKFYRTNFTDNCLIVFQIAKINTAVHLKQDLPYFKTWIGELKELKLKDENTIPITDFFIYFDYNVTLNDVSLNIRRTFYPIIEINEIKSSGSVGLLEFATFSCFYEKLMVKVAQEFFIPIYFSRVGFHIYINLKSQVNSMKLNINFGYIKSMQDLLKSLDSLFRSSTNKSGYTILDIMRYSIHGFNYMEIENFNINIFPIIDPYIQSENYINMNIKNCNFSLINIYDGFDIEAYNLNITLSSHSIFFSKL